jgi:hypothetical protein
MTQPGKLSWKPSGESPSSNRGYLTSLIAQGDPQRVVFVYVLGMALLIMGGLYSIWRMTVLSAFQARAWEYMKERDARWEKVASDQAELTREILRRLPPK